MWSYGIDFLIAVSFDIGNDLFFGEVILLFSLAISFGYLLVFFKKSDSIKKLNAKTSFDGLFVSLPFCFAHFPFVKYVSRNKTEQLYVVH